MILRQSHTAWQRAVSALFAVVVAGVATSATPTDPSDPANWSTQVLPGPVNPLGGEPSPNVLILDDGSSEQAVGFSAATAFQFLWFNQFQPAGSKPFDLVEIQVLFPPGPQISPGAAIQLVVYHDFDGDPASGANLRLAFDDVIQVTDGVTFSRYPIEPPLRIPPGSEAIIGVVNRYVSSGVSPPSRPAALDTTVSSGRSWFALWSGDPPAFPVLPPELSLQRIDVIEPGNWMIRGVASPPPVVFIPTLDEAGLAVLAALLCVAGLATTRRRTRKRRSGRASRSLAAPAGRDVSPRSISQRAAAP